MDIWLTGFGLIVEIWGILAWFTAKFGALKSIILTPIVLGVGAFSLIESLSFFDLLSVELVRALLLLVFGLLLTRYQQIFRGTKELVRVLRQQLRGTFSPLARPFNLVLSFTLIVTIGTIIVSFIVSIFYPPNNLDSLAYHLPRIMRWLQNNNVNFFVTNNNHQLDIPPLGEYFGLITFSVFKTDQFLNLVQFFALIQILLIVYSISLQLLRKRNIAFLSVVIAASAQTILTQATTTQVDLIASVWPLLLILLVVSLVKERVSIGFFIFSCSMLFLLAGATKPTSVLFMAILGLLVVYLVVSGQIPKINNRIVFIFQTSVVSIFGLFVGMLPQAIRNYNWFGSPLGTHTTLLNEKYGLLETTLGVVRIYFNNVGLPLEDFSTRAINKIVTFAGINWVDPSNVLAGQYSTITSAMGMVEDVARSPFQLIGGTIAAVLLIVGISNSDKLIKSLCFVFFFFIIIQATFLKWNYWTNRFYIPIFLLGSILFAIFIGKLLNVKRFLPQFFAYIGIFTALISSIFGLYLSLNQPVRNFNSIINGNLISRDQAYFSYLPGKYESFRELASQLSQLPNGSTVRIYAEQDELTYALWPLANHDFRLSFEFVSPEFIDENKQANRPDFYYCLNRCDEVRANNQDISFSN